MKREFPPLLLPGLHTMNIQKLRKLCVTNFPEPRKQRNTIMSGLELVLSNVTNSGIFAEVWINGSFLTKKSNPDDSDIIILWDPTKVENRNMSVKNIINFLGNKQTKESLKNKHYCDLYIDRKSPHRIDYWTKEFGESRLGEGKGIAVIHFPTGSQL